MKDLAVDDSRIANNPIYSFGSEAVESDYGHFEVLFLGVFNLIMADAVEGLHEHHDGGDAGAGNFGCVVEWAGRHAVRGARDFPDGLFAEIKQVGMEWDGLDVPEA